MEAVDIVVLEAEGLAEAASVAEAGVLVVEDLAGVAIIPTIICSQ